MPCDDVNQTEPYVAIIGTDSLAALLPSPVLRHVVVGVIVGDVRDKDKGGGNGYAWWRWLESGSHLLQPLKLQMGIVWKV